ncbi:DUF971 domain-containing protein [Hoeflea sp. WL0058]|uniref:DUF971 domain-containing protein n=1 Tax=Flavimaribacter sediminis TaxID=2865987 RepID=A0AAE3CZ86_9HYPH|nr:DUF971 domain-containing protein [Flavimaribacter sediminis]MBW8636414.1 DUF971 domain-containing protein [Flavimaribacter sediminis]
MSRPSEIRVSKDRRVLTVSFDSGEVYALSAEMLRVLSPSAEVQGHSPDQRVTVPGKINVEIVSVQPVGNYAVRIGFDDMHDTGIYTWTYLQELGSDHDRLWRAYLDELSDKGMTRERADRPR